MKKILFFLTLFLLGAGMSFAQNVLFVKDGVTDGEVITEGGVTGAAYTTLKAAVAASSVGDTVRLLKDVGEDGTTSNPYGVCVAIIDRITIDGNNHSIVGSGMSGSYSSVFYLKGGTIKNFTSITGGFRTIFSGGPYTADMFIDNCLIEAGSGAYPFNTDAANINYSVTISNCQINGWTSFTGDFKSFTITNTTFGKSTSGYAFLRPYSPTLMEECEFPSSFEVDPRQDQILFNDCTLNGSPLTSDNLDNLLSVAQENPNSKAVVVDGNYSQNSNGEITGGIYGGNPDVLSSMLASGYAAFPLGTDPQTYQVDPAYFIHFDAAGGTGTQGDSVVMRSNPTFVVPDNTEFSYGSYGFLNWNSKPYGAGTDIAVGSTMTLSSDTTLYAEWNIDFVAKIGTTTYPTIQEAVDYANANLTGDVTIDLVKSTSEVVKILQKNGISIMLNGNDVTLTGQIFISNRQETPAYVGDHTAPNTITINNLNMKYDPAYYDDNGSADESGLIYFCKNCAFGNVLNYSHNVTISNCDFDADGSNKSIYAISSIAGTVYNLDIINCTAKNALGLATLQSAPEFEVTGCKTEDVTYGIRIVNNYGPMTVNNNNFTADEAGFYVTGMTTGAVINFAEDTVNAAKAFKLDPSCTSGTLDITSGLYIGEVDDNASSDFFNISGGTYSKDVSGEPCAPGYAAFDNGDGTWTVTKAWFLYYDKNQVGASGTMDTLFVKQDGTVAERTLVVENCAFTWLPDHSFKAWNTKANALGDTLHPGDNITLTSDTTLYVIWQEGYTVFYYNNGGTGTIPNQSKAVGETITLSDGSAFSKTDSTLYWWNTEADESGTGYALGAEYSDDANLNLYAAWRLNLNMTMDSTDVVCYGENNGTDTVKIIGGEMPFKLVLSGTEDRTIPNIMTRTYVFENLKPGSYTVTLTDTLNKDIITGTFTIAQPDTLIVETMTVPVKPCPLMGTGVYNVSMTTTGGNGDNHFVWSDAAVNVDAMATTVIPGADDRDSTYTVTVTVTDKKGCTATRTETFSVSPVIADDGTVHANSKLTTNPDTIKVGIYQGCDTIIRDFGTYVFTSTNPAIDVNILDTVYNDVDVNYPDSTFPVGYSTITWTAVDTCGHSITGEQVVYIYHFPCPDVDLDGYTYHSVRLGCNCWTNENLRAEKYSDGRAIPNVMTYVSDLHPDATANANTYGHLYDWYAAVDTETNSIADIEANYALGKHIQGICPDGWYLPNDEDFNDFDAYETKDLRSTDNWLISGGEGPGTNATGFNAEPSGFYDCATGRFEDLGTSSFYWSCHPVLDMATGAMIAYVCERLQKPKQMPRCNGLSVRCVLIYE